MTQSQYNDDIDVAMEYHSNQLLQLLNRTPDPAAEVVTSAFREFLRQITPIIQAHALDELSQELDKRAHAAHASGFKYGLEHAANFAFKKAAMVRDSNA